MKGRLNYHKNPSECLQIFYCSLFSLLFYSPLPTVLLAVAQFAYPNHNPWTLSTVACPYCSFAWVVSVSLCGCCCCRCCCCCCSCCCCCDCCWVQNARHCLQSRATKLIFQVISRHLHGAPYTRYTQCARAGTSVQAGSVSRHELERVPKQNVSFSAFALFAMVFVIATRIINRTRGGGRGQQNERVPGR